MKHDKIIRHMTKCDVCIWHRENWAALCCAHSPDLSGAWISTCSLVPQEWGENCFDYLHLEEGYKKDGEASSDLACAHALGPEPRACGFSGIGTCWCCCCCSPPARWGLLDFIRAVPPPPPPPHPPPPPPPRSPDPSGHSWTSTASARSQWALPDLHREQIPVGTAGPPPRAPDPTGTAGPQPRLPGRSGHCRTSTASSRSQWALPDLNGQIECQKICQIECQNICHIECQKICQIECQKICQIECQKICQNICQIECQKICQIECQKICQIECQKICQNNARRYARRYVR